MKSLKGNRTQSVTGAHRHILGGVLSLSRGSSWLRGGGQGGSFGGYVGVKRASIGSVWQKSGCPRCLVRLAGRGLTGAAFDVGLGRGH